MFGGKPVRAREYMTDSRGFVAELMSKSMKPEQFAAPMTKDDFERLREYLKYLGSLDPSFKYVGLEQRGPRGARLHEARTCSRSRSTAGNC